MESDIFYKHKYDILVIVVMTFFFNYKFGIICMLLYALLFILTHFKINEKLLEKSNKQCRPNSHDNPYGNYIIGSNPEISDCNDEDLKESNNKINLYENAHDKTIGSINKGLRDFYTMPVTNYPNDHIAFAKYLLPTTASCKIDGNCLQHDDIRYHTR